MGGIREETGEKGGREGGEGSVGATEKREEEEGLTRSTRGLYRLSSSPTHSPSGGDLRAMRTDGRRGAEGDA